MFAADYGSSQLAPIVVDAVAHARAGTSFLYGAFFDDTLAGVASVQVGKLEYLLVQPEYRGRKVATGLLNTAAKQYPVYVPNSQLDIMLDNLSCAEKCEGGYLYVYSRSNGTSP